MDNVKVNLTIYLPGRYIASESPATQNAGFEDKERVEKTKKGIQTTSYSSRVINPRSTRMVVNLTKEAYNYMTSNECPAFSKRGIWTTLSKKNRLDAHCKELAAYYGGKKYHFTILED